MSLTASLYAATSGLHVTQRSIDVVSRNIANAAVDGYTTKYLPTQSLVVGGEVRGITTGQITRQVDADLQRQVRQQSSLSQGSELTAGYLRRLDLALGDPSSESSVPSRLSAMMDDFLQLQGQPQSRALQQSVISSAQGLVAGINQTADEITALRQQAENQLESTAQEINTLVSQIDKLNRDISRQDPASANIADLEDSRDQLLKKLSGFIDIQTYRTSNNQIHINVGNGRALLDHTVHSLTFNAQPVSANSKYTAPTPSPSAAPALEGITLDGRDISDEIDSGELRALVDLRDDTLIQAQAQLDEFAGVLISTFEAQGLTLFTDPSNPSPFPYPGTAVIGLASRLEVNQAVIDEPWRVRDGTTVGAESTTPGDTSLIDSILTAVNDTPQTFRTTGLGPAGSGVSDVNSNLVGSATLFTFATGFYSYQAVQINDSYADRDFQSSLNTALQDEFLSESAVDVDAQLAELVKLETAYSASARVLTTVQQLFDELLSTVR